MASKLVVERAPKNSAKFRDGLVPKIVLSVHQGFSIRYLLQTNILTELRRSGAKLVILSQTDPETFRAAFGDENIEYELIPAEVGEAANRRGRIQRALKFIRAYVHADDVQTTDHHLAIALSDAAVTDPSLYTRINLRLMTALIVVVRRIRWLRRFLFYFEAYIYVPAPYEEFMTRQTPELVVTTSLGTFNYDQYVMRAARKAGVKTASVILSWDNPTTRGYPGALADHTIAWTETMKGELVTLNDVAENSISVKGIAHFDDYFREDTQFRKSNFLRNLGCDSDKRTILIATKSPNCYAQNPNIAQILARAIEDGALPPDCQVLVRIHPLHYRLRDGKIFYQDVLDVYHTLAARHACLLLNEPDIRLGKVNYDMSPDEIRFLPNLMRSIDILVNMFSTMNIEAALFNVPLINVCFDDIEPLYPSKRNHRHDIMIDYESDHNQRIVNSGGTRIAWTAEDLVQQVKDYLLNPSLDQEGRAAIVSREIGPNRGYAGEAIGQQIFSWAQQAQNGQ